MCSDRRDGTAERVLLERDVADVRLYEGDVGKGSPDIAGKSGTAAVDQGAGARD